MVGNQYDASVHDTPVFCPDDSCGVKNAPPGSAEYDDECWRCGETLPSADVGVGDVVSVRVVDENHEESVVTKADSGLVVFVHEEVSDPEFTVELTDVDRNCAYGTQVDAPVEQAEQSSSRDSPPKRLGSRENFWGE